MYFKWVGNTPEDVHGVPVWPTCFFTPGCIFPEATKLAFRSSTVVLSSDVRVAVVLLYTITMIACSEDFCYQFLKPILDRCVF